jgi:hypothetical protein
LGISVGDNIFGIGEVAMTLYEHKQKGPLYLILVGVGIAMLPLAAGTWRTNRHAAIIPAVVALLMFFFAACFVYLVVREEGEYLGVWFGPLRLFGRRIAFSQITAVERSRSDVLDGWGIHALPGRGIIYNLWGFDCVKLKVGRRTVRIGTDDVEGLVVFLKEKVEKSQ